MESSLPCGWETRRRGAEGSLGTLKWLEWLAGDLLDK